MKKIYTSILLALLSISSAIGQDSQFSLYDASPVLLNPALTGTDKENPIRATAQYRNQWRSVSSSFVTSAFSVDLPLERWGVGAYLSNNETSRLISELNFVVSGSYDILKQGQNKHHLSTGVNIGFINKRLDPDELVFDSQFDERVFNENIESGETLVRESRLLPATSFGVNYKFTDPDKIYHPYLGASLFNLTRPDESFIIAEDSRLPLRYVINGGTYLYFDDRKIVLNPKAIYVGQGNSSNVMLGLTGDYTFNEEISANAGVTYRIKDAIIPQIGIHYLNFTYLISYDINVSKLRAFSNSRGALEFALVYNGSTGKIKDLIKGVTPGSRY